jgi:hypothetical protein
MINILAGQLSAAQTFIPRSSDRGAELLARVAAEAAVQRCGCCARLGGRAELRRAP